MVAFKALRDLAVLPSQPQLFLLSSVLILLLPL